MTRFTAASAVVLGIAVGTAAQRPPEPYRVFGLPVQPRPPWWAGPGKQPPPPPKPQPQPPQPWWAGIPAPQGPAFRFARPSVALRGIDPNPPLYAGPLARSWASRVSADVEQLKQDAAAANLAPAARRAIDDRADAALREAERLEGVIGERDRRDWPAAEATVRSSLQELQRAVAQSAGNDPNLRLSGARVRYAGQQLAVAVVLAVDASPEQMQAIVRFLGAGLADQAERLQESLANVAPAAERDARQFARAASRFAADLATATDFVQARNALVRLGNEWDDVAVALARTPDLPARVQFQATRVDGLHRRLTDLFDVTTDPPTRPLPPQPRRVSVVAAGADDGMPPRVVVYGDGGGTVAYAFEAYNRGLFKTGVRVAVADLNGDGLPEVVTVPGGGNLARIWVFDGRDMTPTVRIDAFGGREYRHAHTVAAADLTRDGRALVAIAPDTGGPSLVEVYDLAAGRHVATVPAFGERFVGGTRLAWGDVNGDGAPDLVTATGPGQIGTEVKVFDGQDFRKVLSEFHVLDAKFQGGAWVAAADLSRNNRAEVVVGLDAGSRPLLRVFEGATGKMLGEAEPYPANFRGGVRVAIGDPSDRDRMKVIVGPGAGGRDLPLKIIRPDGKVVSELDPFPRSNRGMFVGSR